jgi:hypothetical protein
MIDKGWKIIQIVLLVAVLWIVSSFVMGDAKNTELELVQSYTNEEYGYEIQYPVLFNIDESRTDYVQFDKDSCNSYEELCIPGLDGFTVLVTENTEEDDLETYSERMVGCQELDVFEIYSSYQIETLRCGFDAVPKQAKGGYTYTILEGDLIYEISFFQGDSYVAGLEQDTYDPIGDMIMQTFRFLQ